MPSRDSLRRSGYPKNGCCLTLGECGVILPPFLEVASRTGYLEIFFPVRSTLDQWYDMVYVLVVTHGDIAIHTEAFLRGI